MKTFDEIYLPMLRSKGLDPIIGENVVRYIADTNLYLEVDSQKVELTLTTNPSRCGPTPFARALLSTITRIVASPIGEDMDKAGMTPELQGKWLKEREDPAVETLHDFWFIKARLKA
ncbi:hypothetical protein AAF712_008314 [Marasmius tenuissimus]|uniref:MIP18 family-like domain-containing protein n=1 Tax=Marasmius tenuissimus TaxID=585030 RepID=A0ABR2ZWW2_9AGAR